MNSSVVLAGRWRRLGAWLIDAILVPSLTLFLVMVAGVVEDAEDYTNNWWMLWVLLIAIVSYLILNGYGLMRRGQTIGKQMMGIAIVSHMSAQNTIGAQLWKLIFIRALFFPVSFLIVVPPFLLLPLLDHLLIFRSNRRCLHDLLAGTMVIRIGKN